jgi:hypothetical protein
MQEKGWHPETRKGVESDEILRGVAYEDINNTRQSEKIH